eukprot:gene9262-1349_t
MTMEEKELIKKLGDAIKDDDITKIKQLLDSGFNLKKPYKEKSFGEKIEWTPLQYAAALGSQKSCNFLIQNGSNLEIKDKTNRSAKDIASLLDKKIDFGEASLTNHEFLDLRNEVSVEKQQLENLKSELSKQKRIVIAIRATVKEKELQQEKLKKEIENLKKNLTFTDEIDFEGIKEKLKNVNNFVFYSFGELNSIYFDLYRHIENWKKNNVNCKDFDDEILNTPALLNIEIPNEELVNDISNQFFKKTLNEKFQNVINDHIKTLFNSNSDFSEIPKIIDDFLKKKVANWKNNLEKDEELENLKISCKIDDELILKKIKKKYESFELLPSWKLKINELLKLMSRISDDSSGVIESPKSEKIQNGVSEEILKKRKENPTPETNFMKKKAL